MNTLLRAVITGFGFSLGAALFKRAANKMGWTEATATSAGQEAGAATPSPGHVHGHAHANA